MPTKYVLGKVNTVNKTYVHPLTRWSIVSLFFGFFLPSLVVLVYFVLYASINQTNVTPVNDVVVQVAVLYGASGLAIIDLGEQIKKKSLA